MINIDVSISIAWKKLKSSLKFSSPTSNKEWAIYLDCIPEAFGILYLWSISLLRSEQWSILLTQSSRKTSQSRTWLGIEYQQCSVQGNKFDHVIKIFTIAQIILLMLIYQNHWQSSAQKNVRANVRSSLKADCQIWLCATSKNRQIKSELIHLDISFQNRPHLIMFIFRTLSNNPEYALQSISMNLSLTVVSNTRIGQGNHFCPPVCPRLNLSTYPFKLLNKLTNFLKNGLFFRFVMRI